MRTWGHLAAKVRTSKGRGNQWQPTPKKLPRTQPDWALVPAKPAQRLNTTTTTTTNNNNNNYTVSNDGFTYHIGRNEEYQKRNHLSGPPSGRDLNVGPPVYEPGTPNTPYFNYSQILTLNSVRKITVHAHTTIQ
jgi:hypothetical protein